MSAGAEKLRNVTSNVSIFMGQEGDFIWGKKKS